MALNELDLIFPAPNNCAKFQQIATAEARTDRQTGTHTDASDLIPYPMLCCNSNGTEDRGIDLALTPSRMRCSQPSLTPLEGFVSGSH